MAAYFTQPRRRPSNPTTPGDSPLRGRGLYGYIDELMPPVWLDSGQPVPITEEPGAVKIFVAGAEFGGYTAALFGEGRTVTEEVAQR